MEGGLDMSGPAIWKFRDVKETVDPIVYVDGTERRTLDLRPDGIACVPLIGVSNFQSVGTGTEEHIHPGCVEIALCLRGNLMFESFGMEYPFLPGTVFVSSPDEPHRMRSNPKGLMLYRLLFKIPGSGETILGLSGSESNWLAKSLQNFPVRLFPAPDRVKIAFERIFSIYDTEKRKTSARRLKMKAATLELLLSLVEAPFAASSKKGKPNKKVNGIVERMKSSPTGDFQVDELAREAGLSTVAFFDVFKRATGLPPHAFLLDVRIKAAARELENPALLVSDVARRYGFSSPQHFATAFKRIMGISPRRR